MFIYQGGLHRLEFEGNLKDINRLSLISKLPIRIYEAENTKMWRVTLGNKRFIEILKLSTEKEKLRQFNLSLCIRKKSFTF